MNCEIEIINSCEAHKCRNNGICKPREDGTKGYQCLCNTNFSGNYCEKSIDNCKDIDCEFSEFM